MNKEKLLADLKEQQEMNPDKHDGSYELMREIVASYAKLQDLSQCDYLDLNAIYAMAIGTWRLNVEKKKEYVHKSHLSEEEKAKVASIIDQVWDNACHGKYANMEGNRPSIGMFGTGLYSFQNKTTPMSVQQFIEMLVDIIDSQDDVQIYNRVERVLNREFKGMAAASASFVLHCLKPYTFPVINGAYGDAKSFFGMLGVKLNRPASIDTYVENCRKIKEFRDTYLPFKNYRILDQWASKVDAYREEYYPSLEEYNPDISYEQYVELLQNENVVKKPYLDTIYYLYKMGGEATCTQISARYGNTAFHYNANAKNVGRWISDAVKCPLYKSAEEGGGFWAVLFIGRKTRKGEEGVFVWRLRQPLAEAVAALDEAGFFKEFDVVKEAMDFDLNTILYGPPGTGKTYNTVLYAVAMVEKKTLKDIREEAEADYSSLKKRFDDYKSSGIIAFTTFHQSYGYEEFIEGIKPIVDADTSEVGYKIEPGIFKAFCEKASETPIEDTAYTSNVWVYRNRAGGKDVSPDYEERLYSEGVIKVENLDDQMRQCDLIKRMSAGDWVVLGRDYTINAIGIVSDDEISEIDDGVFHFQKKVDWKVTGINEDCREINRGRGISNFVISKGRMKVHDLQKLINGNSKNEQPHVFIIDEINRGNISKIFGELITLIEDTKRAGKREEASAVLPYSGDIFSVPSNVFILGTMNTADRSIALMDTALRRRFQFVEMMPDADVLRKIGADRVVSGEESLDVATMLEVINKRIECLYDREHTIGHAFFTGLKDDPTIEKLAGIFEKSVIPLLQEYFYEDYKKIQFVLGDDGKRSEEDRRYQFIRDISVRPMDLFNTPPEFDTPDIKYEIQRSALMDIMSYKKIAKGL